MSEPTPPTAREFLAVAESLGDGLCSAARWDGGDSCTWEVPDGEGTADADGSLYDGTGGIALFLLHLHRRTAKAEHLRTARGALHYSIAREAEEEKAAGGYYCGTAGLAAACLEMAAGDEDGSWLETTRTLVRKLDRGLLADGQVDVLSGEAGSVLGLLQVHAVLGDEESLATARALGDRLLVKRRREPDGTSWDVLHPKVYRNLTGLSHGAGGVGLSLLELYRATGDPRYLVGAAEALRYEDSFPAAADGNWPDLRHASVARYLEEGSEKELVRDLVAGKLEARPGNPMMAWCHGAPGISLVRARFCEVTGLTRFRAGLERALECTLGLREMLPNHSCCHGLCGNADVLLELGRRLDDERCVEAADRLARRALDETAEGSWKSGARDRRPAPGLLLGEAGIGLFFLRLAAPEVPCCLLPVPAGRAPGAAEIDEELLAEGLRKGFLEHFPRTEKALAELGADLSHLTGESCGEILGSLKETVEGLARDGDDGGDLREVLELETSAFELLRAHDDYSRPYLAALLRRPAEALGDPSTLVRLARGSRLFRAEHDWEALRDGGLRGVVRRATTYLLYEADHSTRVRRLDPLSAKMFALLDEPITTSALVEDMLRHLVDEGMLEDAGGEEAEEARESLGKVLERGFRSEMIETVEPYDLEPGDVTSEVCVRCGECCRIQIHVPGDAGHGKFVREMLEEPLRETYPEARVYLEESQKPPYVVLSLGDCRHLARGTGDEGGPCITCAIYQRRPQTCRQFNCVVWWREQRLRSAGRTNADRVIEKVAKLLGRPRRTALKVR